MVQDVIASDEANIPKGTFAWEGTLAPEEASSKKVLIKNGILTLERDIVLKVTIIAKVTVVSEGATVPIWITLPKLETKQKRNCLSQT